uniref:Uncharacterized protein n=1 Tax=Meloidogyne javanica TaxID=6303 RepID=A0A915N2A9_MELJA
MFLFVRPIKPIILPNNIFDLNLQWILQNKIYGIRQFSSKSEGIIPNELRGFIKVRTFKLPDFSPIRLAGLESRNPETPGKPGRSRGEQLEQEKPLLIEPTDLQRKMVVWTGMYSNLSEVPAKLNSFQVKRHGKSLIRRILCMAFILYASMFYIYRCDETENRF